MFVDEGFLTFLRRRRAVSPLCAGVSQSNLTHRDSTPAIRESIQSSAGLVAAHDPPLEHARGGRVIALA
jgi:hypothetical protein